MIEKRKYPYFAKQTWRHIFFFNWPVNKELLEQHIPKPFKLDLFNRKAWISLVTFQATKSHLRSMPAWTAFPKVTQINFRTYVTFPGSQEKGVYFFSLTLNSLMAAIGGREIFQLPFQYKNVDMRRMDKQVSINHLDENLLNFSYELDEIDDLALVDFITERYCIWNVKGKQLIKIPILHPKWTVQKCCTEETERKLFTQLKLPQHSPITFYSDDVETKLYPYENVGYYSY